MKTFPKKPKLNTQQINKANNELKAQQKIAKKSTNIRERPVVDTKHYTKNVKGEAQKLLAMPGVKHKVNEQEQRTFNMIARIKNNPQVTEQNKKKRIEQLTKRISHNSTDKGKKRVNKVIEKMPYQQFEGALGEDVEGNDGNDSD